MSPAKESPHVIDVTDADFDQRVLEESRSRPVVVDFWAKWCGPCRALGPLLEDLADEYEGRFLLAKIDIDQQPRLAEQFRVSSIPMVAGIIDGARVSHFMGNQPEPSVRAFIEQLLPSEVDQLIKEASAFESTDLEQARLRYEKALELDAKNSLAAAGLAECWFRQGDVGRARTYVEQVGEGTDGWARAQHVSAKLGFLEARQRLGTLEECLARVQAEPENLERQVELGQFQASMEAWEPALETFVTIVEKNRDFGNDHVKPLMVQIFGILGQNDDLVMRYRSRLASALY